MGSYSGLSCRFGGGLRSGDESSEEEDAEDDGDGDFFNRLRPDGGDTSCFRGGGECSESRRYFCGLGEALRRLGGDAARRSGVGDLLRRGGGDGERRLRTGGDGGLLRGGVDGNRRGGVRLYLLGDGERPR